MPLSDRSLRLRARLLSPTAVEVWIPLLSLFAAALAGAIVMWFGGLHPWPAYSELVHGAFGSIGSFSETLLRFCPLALCALAVLVGFRASFFTIGVEGQFSIGALFAVYAGLHVHASSRMIAIPLCLAAGMLGGALWALLAGILKVRFKVNEVISTMMLNVIATLLIDYLIRGPLREPGTELQQTARLPFVACLPRILPHTRLHPGVAIPLVAGALLYVFFWHSAAGYRVRVAGANPLAARFAGISVAHSTLLAVALSGCIAGIAGAIEVQAVSYRLQAGIAAEYGFTAIPIALLGRVLIGPTLVAALLFAALSVGSTMMSLKAAVPLPLVTMLEGAIVLFVITGEMLKARGLTRLAGAGAQPPSQRAEDPPYASAPSPPMTTDAPHD